MHLMGLKNADPCVKHKRTLLLGQKLLNYHQRQKFASKAKNDYFLIADCQSLSIITWSVVPPLVPICTFYIINTSGRKFFIIIIFNLIHKTIELCCVNVLFLRCISFCKRRFGYIQIVFFVLNFLILASPPAYLGGLLTFEPALEQKEEAYNTIYSRVLFACLTQRVESLCDAASVQR
jgi:hypothetical protein